MSRVAICFGGPSPEHDISILTGLQATHCLAKLGDNPIALYWSRTGAWFEVPATSEGAQFADDAPDGVPEGARPLELQTGTDGGFFAIGRRAKRSPLEISIVLNCCHGAPGEDGTLQAMFDLAGLRYSGPSHAGAALGIDKFAFTSVIRSAGLQSLPLWLLQDDLMLTDTTAPLAEGPLIVKPRFGGSSIGIEIVDDLETAKALAASAPTLADGAVVQQYQPDSVDLNLSLLAWPTLRLSAVERPLRSEGATHPSGDIYSYADKYLRGEAGMASAARELPAELPEPIEQALTDAAIAVAGITQVRSVSRLDFLWDRTDDPRGLLVNELNTIPGSLCWYFWTQQGISFGELLHNLVDETLALPERRFRTDGADGTALRSVTSISSKLA